MPQSKKLKISASSSLSVQNITSRKISSESNRCKQSIKHKTKPKESTSIDTIADSVSVLLQSTKNTIEDLSIQKVLSTCSVNYKDCIPFCYDVEMKDVALAYNYFKDKVCVHAEYANKNHDENSKEIHIQNKTIPVEKLSENFCEPLLNEKSASLKQEQINFIHLRNKINYYTSTVSVSSGYVTESETEEIEKSPRPEDKALLSGVGNKSQVDGENKSETTNDKSIQTSYLTNDMNVTDLVTTKASNQNSCSIKFLDQNLPHNPPTPESFEIQDSRKSFGISPKSKISFNKIVNQTALQKSIKINKSPMRFLECSLEGNASQLCDKRSENILNSASNSSGEKNVCEKKESQLKAVSVRNAYSLSLNEPLVAVHETEMDTENRKGEKVDKDSLKQAVVSKKPIKRKNISKMSRGEIASKNKNTSEFSNTSSLSTNSFSDELFNESAPPDFLKKAKLINITVKSNERTLGLAKNTNARLELCHETDVSSANKTTNTSLNDRETPIKSDDIDKSKIKLNLASKKALKRKRIGNSLNINKTNKITSIITSCSDHLDDVLNESVPPDFLLQAKLMKMTFGDSPRTLKVTKDPEINESESTVVLCNTSSNKDEVQNCEVAQNAFIKEPFLEVDNSCSQTLAKKPLKKKIKTAIKKYLAPSVEKEKNSERTLEVSPEISSDGKKNTNIRTGNNNSLSLKTSLLTNKSLKRKTANSDKADGNIFSSKQSTDNRFLYSAQNPETLNTDQETNKCYETQSRLTNTESNDAFNKNLSLVSSPKNSLKRKIVNESCNIEMNSGISDDKNKQTTVENSQSCGDEEENVLLCILSDPVEEELQDDILLPEDLKLSTFAENSSVTCYESISSTPRLSICSRASVTNNFSNQGSDSEGSDVESSFKRRKSTSTQISSPSALSTFQEVERRFDLSDNFSHGRSSVSSLSSATNRNVCCAPSIHSRESPVPSNLSDIGENLQDPNCPLEDGNVQRSFQEIIEAIQRACINCDVQEAISFADKYIPISTVDVQIEIFRALFINIIKNFKISKPNLKSDKYDDATDAFHRLVKENNLYDADLCSKIVYESFSSELCIRFATDVFLHCMENQIKLSTESIFKYAEFLKKDGHAASILTFLNLIKNVEYITIPHTLYQDLLETCACDRLMTSKDFTELCQIICDAKSIEVEKDTFYRKFFRNCIEKELWAQLNKIFCSCIENNKTEMLKDLFLALAFPLSEAGDCFQKFAASVFNSSDDVPDLVMVRFAQFGAGLLLETYVNEELRSSLEILILLHQYNINYWEILLPLAFCATDNLVNCYPKCLNYYTFMDTVVHVAIDIFLHFNRPQDAFIEFQAFFSDSLSTFDNPDLKKDAILNRYSVLLRITDLLSTSDLLGNGLKALNILLSIDKKDVTLESETGFMKELSKLYNKYLTMFLNENYIDGALDLFEKKCGSLKEKLNLDIFPCVRRGLIISYANKGLIEKAKKQFCVAYIKNNYPIIKPGCTKSLFSYWVRSYWTVHEIKFALEMFFEELHPLLITKDAIGSMGSFKIWLQIKVNKLENNSVKCLVEVPNDLESAFARTREALKLIDSNLNESGKEMKKKKQSMKRLEIPSEVFYQFWKKKFCPPLGKSVNKGFVVNCKQRISFGIIEPERNAADFERITLFLLRRVQLKHRDLTPEVQHQKASNLAVSFVRTNQVVEKLDRKSMKLLHDFAEKCL